MSQLSYNGVIHAALSLAKDSDEKSLLVARDIYDLLVETIIPMLLTEYLSLSSLPTHVKPPSYDEKDKYIKMAKWTSGIRGGDFKDEMIYHAQAIKIVIGSGLWSIIHILAIIAEKEPQNSLARRAFNFVARSSVIWIACPICSTHWSQSIDDVDNATKESETVLPVRTIERMLPSELFAWTVKIHNIASGGDGVVAADPVLVRTHYLLRYKKYVKLTKK